MIHELCTFVLLNTRKESLIRATLTALHAYLSWVPVGCAGARRSGGLRAPAWGRGAGWEGCEGGGSCGQPCTRRRRSRPSLTNSVPPPPPPVPAPPSRYIFESNMVQLLLNLFPQAPFRNVALQCLTEVAALTMDETFDDRFQSFFKIFSQQLFSILPPGARAAASPRRPPLACGRSDPALSTAAAAGD
jgi:hypothetical protein